MIDMIDMIDTMNITERELKYIQVGMIVFTMVLMYAAILKKGNSAQNKTIVELTAAIESLKKEEPVIRTRKEWLDVQLVKFEDERVQFEDEKENFLINKCKNKKKDEALKEENKALQNKVTSLKDENKALQNKVTPLKEENKALKEEKDRLKLQHNCITEEHNYLTQEQDRLLQENVSLNDLYQTIISLIPIPII